MRSVNVVLSDGRTLQLREPMTSEMGIYLGAMPAFSVMQALKKATDSCMSGVMVPIPDVPAQLMTGLWRLLSMLSGIPEDKLMELPAADTLTLMSALNDFGKNPTTAETSTTSAGAAA
jgi:hypothetical protein